jgi:hypothetical protein
MLLTLQSSTGSLRGDCGSRASGLTRAHARLNSQQPVGGLGQCWAKMLSHAPFCSAPGAGQHGL